MRKNTFASGLLAAPILVGLAGIAGLSGCWVVAVGAGSVLIADQVLDNNNYLAEVAVDSRRVWVTTKATLSHLSLSPIEVDDDLKQAKARYDGANVTVQIETLDVEKSTIRVSATKFGVNNGEIANEVMRKLIAELDA